MCSATRAESGKLPSGTGTLEKLQLQSDLLRVDIISWGCTIMALEVRQAGEHLRRGAWLFKLEGYLQKQFCFGAVVGGWPTKLTKNIHVRWDAISSGHQQRPVGLDVWMEDSKGLIRFSRYLRYCQMVSGSLVSVQMLRKATPQS